MHGYDPGSGHRWRLLVLWHLPGTTPAPHPAGFGRGSSATSCTLRFPSCPASPRPVSTDHLGRLLGSPGWRLSLRLWLVGQTHWRVVRVDGREPMGLNRRSLGVVFDIKFHFYKRCEKNWSEIKNDKSENDPKGARCDWNSYFQQKLSEQKHTAVFVTEQVVNNVHLFINCFSMAETKCNISLIGVPQWPIRILFRFSPIGFPLVTKSTSLSSCCGKFNISNRRFIIPSSNRGAEVKSNK